MIKQIFLLALLISTIAYGGGFTSGDASIKGATSGQNIGDTSGRLHSESTIKGNTDGTLIGNTSDQMHVRLPTHIDDISDSLIIIDFPHHETHEGDAFVFSGQGVIASGAQSNFIITTGDVSAQTHMVFAIRAASEASYTIYEDATNSTGAVQLVFNRNRTSSNTANTLIHFDSAASVTGTKIYEEHFGSGKNQQGESRGTSEFVLDENSVYLLNMNSEAATNDMSWQLNFYEHTPSN